MDCCKVEGEAATVTTCPACGGRGRRVKRATVAALAREDLAPRDGSWRFCGTKACEVVWFDERGQRLTLAASRVRVHQKEDGEDRPVCYCFGHTVADVRAGLGTDGRNAVADAITERCRRGEDRCEETNPQGSCCLGNVRAIGRAS